MQLHDKHMALIDAVRLNRPRHSGTLTKPRTLMAWIAFEVACYAFF